MERTLSCRRGAYRRCIGRARRLAVPSIRVSHPSRNQHRMCGEPMTVQARSQISSSAPSRMRSLLIIVAGLFAADGVWACTTPVSVCERDSAGAFALIRSEAPATVVVDASADSAVRSAADNFAADLQRVAGRTSDVSTDLAGVRGTAVIVGTLGQSPIIDALIAAGKIDRRALLQRWEAYTQIVVDRPTPQIDRALVIVGADRRGAVFGTYDVSERLACRRGTGSPTSQRRIDPTCSSPAAACPMRRRCATADCSSTTKTLP